MKPIPLRRTLRLFAATLTLLSAFASAQAAFNGAPVGGPGSVTDGTPANNWTSTLNPNPAIQMSTCPWISAGLTAQNFTPPGWTINQGLTLNGTLTIEKYYAWVTTQPTDNINSKNWGGQGPFNDYGGAFIRLLYTPGAGDPTGASVHWMQGIYTNDPNANGLANGVNVGGGYYEYLDNAGTTGTNPYYDNTPNEPATSTEFLDIPARPVAIGQTINWQAQAFISTWDPANKVINVYNSGVWWGYTLSAIPEPATLALLLVACATMTLRRQQRCAA